MTPASEYLLFGHSDLYLTPNTPDPLAAQAARLVARHAVDTDDRDLLLEALGLDREAS